MTAARSRILGLCTVFGTLYGTIGGAILILVVFEGPVLISGIFSPSRFSFRETIGILLYGVPISAFFGALCGLISGFLEGLVLLRFPPRQANTLVLRLALSLISAFIVLNAIYLIVSVYAVTPVPSAIHNPFALVGAAIALLTTLFAYPRVTRKF